MKNMRIRIPVILSFFLAMILWGCDNDQKVDLSEDPEQREEVYEQILNDKDMFNEFMNKMRENDQSMTWMANHKPMMRNMYGRNQMRHMMRNNPEAMDSIMEGMMIMVKEDTTMIHRNPDMHQRIMQHMMIMMDRDTAMYRQMQERMQQKKMKATK